VDGIPANAQGLFGLIVFQEQTLRCGARAVRMAEFAAIQIILRHPTAKRQQIARMQRDALRAASELRGYVRALAG
jgi:hypothetical protein